jgi:hypothetical protein
LRKKITLLVPYSTGNPHKGTKDIKKEINGKKYQKYDQDLYRIK